MAISISDIVTRSRIYLEDTPWETTLSEELDASEIGIDVPDGTDWDEGDIGEIVSSNEQFYVQSVSSNTLTVVRGYNGSTAATAATGGRVLKNPIFSGRQLTDFATRSVAWLYPLSWKVVSTTLTPVAATVWYTLPAATMGLINVNQLYGASSQYVGIFGGKSGRALSIVRNLPTALVTNNIGLQFLGGFYHASNTINVVYAAKITGTTDIEEGHVAEAVLWKTLSLSLQQKELPRVTSDDVSMGDDGVRPGTRLQAASYYELKAEEEREQAHFELMDTAPIAYPVRD